MFLLLSHMVANCKKKISFEWKVKSNWELLICHILGSILAELQVKHYTIKLTKKLYKFQRVFKIICSWGYVISFSVTYSKIHCFRKKICIVYIKTNKKEPNILLLDAVVADSNRVVPPSLLDGPEFGGAVAAHTLATCSTMVEGEAGSKLGFTHRTLSD